MTKKDLPRVDVSIVVGLTEKRIIPLIPKSLSTVEECVIIAIVFTKIFSHIGILMRKDRKETGYHVWQLNVNSSV